MNRKGVTVPELLIDILIVLAILSFVLFWSNNGFANMRKQTDQLSSCSGVFGSIGGKTGYCSADKSCSDVASRAAADKVTDVYFQYVGSGFGCPDAKNPKMEFCCIGMSKSENPLRATTINAAACQSLQTGTWGYQVIGKSGACTAVSSGSTIMLGPEDQIFFAYKPLQADTNCLVYPELGQTQAITYSGSSNNCFQQADQNGIVSIGPNSPASYYDFAGKDKTALNQNTIALPIKLRSFNGTPGSTKEVAVTLQVTNSGAGSVRYCAATDGGDTSEAVQECFSIKGDIKVGDKCRYGTCQLMSDQRRCSCR